MTQRLGMCSSFDIFDTCLVRRVGPPTETFRLVGRMIGERLDLSRSEEFADHFIEWRSEAEGRARRDVTGEDVQLGEIWCELAKMVSNPSVLTAADAELELDVEWSTIEPVESVRSEVLARRRAGHRIIFVSDMYLPTNFLKRALQHHGFLEATDGIYVSGDLRLTKYSGNLFKHVLGQEMISPGEMQHLGDNEVSDVEVPRRLGIKASLFQAARPHAVEALLLKERPLGSEGPYIKAASDIRLNRMRAKLSATDHNDISSLVEDFLGPVLCLFSHWILARSQADSIQRLFFASRDARLTWAVCKRLAEIDGLPITCRYFFTSRQAVYLPSGSELSHPGMPWLRHSGDNLSLSRLASKLELSHEYLAARWREKFPAWLPQQQLEKSEEWGYLWQLLKSPDIGSCLSSSIVSRRENALAYFQDVGLLDPAPAAIVDLGSLLYCQEAINRICASRREGQVIAGYYMFLRRPRRSSSEAGPAASIVLEPPAHLPHPTALSWLNRSAAIEHVLGLADHPSVRGYGVGGQIEFVSQAVTPSRDKFLQIEEKLLKYVSQYGVCWKDLAAEHMVGPTISLILEDFFRHPGRTALDTLREVQVDDRPLIEPYAWKEVMRELVPYRIAKWLRLAAPMGRYWPEASLRITPAHRRYIYSASQQIRRWRRSR